MAIAQSLQIGVEEALSGYGELTANWINNLQPIAIAGVTLYFILMGFAMAHGSVRDSMNGLLWRMFKIVLICTIALNIDNYQNYVRDGINAIQQEAVGIFLTQDHQMKGDIAPSMQPGKIKPAVNSELGRLVDSKVGYITYLARFFYDQATKPDIPDLPLLLAGLMCSLCQIIIVSATLIPFLVAKTTLTILLSVGPLFILFAIWPATQRFSEAWLSACLTAILTTVLVVVIAGILPAYTGHYASTAFWTTPPSISALTNIEALTGIEPNKKEDVLTKVTELVIVTLVASWLIWKIVSLAISLTHASRFGQFVNTAAHAVFSYLGDREVSRKTHAAQYVSSNVSNTTYTRSAHLAHQHVIKRIQKHN